MGFNKNLEHKCGRHRWQIQWETKTKDREPKEWEIHGGRKIERESWDWKPMSEHRTQQISVRKSTTERCFSRGSDDFVTGLQVYGFLGGFVRIVCRRPFCKDCAGFVCHFVSCFSIFFQRCNHFVMWMWRARHMVLQNQVPGRGYFNEYSIVQKGVGRWTSQQLDKIWVHRFEELFFSCRFYMLNVEFPKGI